MALKNLFDMVKADRYTQDGREELIKAQEAETEDKVYQIGEISQKTGLQKTANGWVKPKSGKQAGAKNAETNYGKVEKKDGKWGVQQKLGKGSQFIEHKDKKDATEALKNYTEGYNTTARSKQDPHSDEARQVKQWNKETEKIKKENRAERRAEHAAQFQNQPALSQTDGKGNKVEIKIIESKGGGFYVDKYVNGKKVGINNANTRESAEAKAKSMMEQHMADPDYRAESKPDAANQRDQIGDEIKGNLEAAKYYFDKAQSFSLTDPSFKTYMSKAKEYNDKAKAQADDNGFDWEEMHNRGITHAVDEFARQNKSKATDAYSWIKREAGDSAPRQLTGDTRIRVRKA